METPEARWDIKNLTWENLIAETKRRLTDCSSHHDVVISVNESLLLYANNQVLCLWSPVFEDLLSQQNNNEVKQLDIHWEPAESVFDLLVAIYVQCDARVYPGVSFSNLAIAADHFQMTTVLYDCQNLMCANFPKLNIMECLNAAVKLNWYDMKFLIYHHLTNCSPLPFDKELLEDSSEDVCDFLMVQFYNIAVNKLDKKRGKTRRKMRKLIEETISDDDIDVIFSRRQILSGINLKSFRSLFTFSEERSIKFARDQEFSFQVLKNFSEINDESQLKCIFDEEKYGLLHLFRAFSPAYHLDRKRWPFESTSKGIIAMAKLIEKYRIPSLALRWFKYLENESIPVCIQLATTFGLTQENNVQRLIDALRKDSPLEWLKKNREEIELIEDKSKALILDCVMKSTIDD